MRRYVRACSRLRLRFSELRALDRSRSSSRDDHGTKFSNTFKYLQILVKICVDVIGKLQIDRGDAVRYCIIGKCT